MHYVWKAKMQKNGKFFWHVIKSGADRWSASLAHGYADTEDQAVRNARNFIRNNQNAVYG